MIKILIFLHGTVWIHKSAAGKSRKEIVEQVKNQDESIRDFKSYLPIGKAVEKLQNWVKQGAEIFYLSALTKNKKARNDEIVGKKGLEQEKELLWKYGFPKGEVYHRQKDKTYAQIAEKILPDILIEDDCESIGGKKEMTSTFIKSEIKKRIKSIVVEEFSGIDDLPSDLSQLKNYGKIYA